MTKAFDDALDPGTRIGPVVLGEAIGQGGFGIVYRAVHDREGDVAVKEFFPKQFASRGSSGTLRASQRRWDEAWASGLAQFAEEARALKRLRHSNIVWIHELIEQNGSAYAVMELVEGETLDRMLAGGRKLAPDQVMSIAKGLIEALRHMNQRGILHRDIAPDNVIITPDGEPMLIDFGGARHQVAQLTMTLPQIARHGYSPFESFKTGSSVEAIGPWTDIYATAALLYRLVTGETPKDSAGRIDERAHSNRDPQPLLSNRKDLLKDYPKAWLAAVDKGLALKPQDRPQSAEAWAEMFREMSPGGLKGMSVAARIMRVAPPKWAAPVAIVLVASVIGVLMLRPSDEVAAWEVATQVHTADGYAAYLAEHPKGPNAGEARKRIDLLDQQAAAIIAAAAAAERGAEEVSEDPGARQKALIRLQTALRSLSLYSGRLDGEFGPATQKAVSAFAGEQGTANTDLLTAPISAIDSLAERAEAEVAEAGRRLAGQKAVADQARQIEDRAWQNSEAAGTVVGYQAYLGSYPSGTYAARARAKIVELQRPAPYAIEQIHEDWQPWVRQARAVAQEAESIAQQARAEAAKARDAANRSGRQIVDPFSLTDDTWRIVGEGENGLGVGTETDNEYKGDTFAGRWRRKLPNGLGVYEFADNSFNRLPNGGYNFSRIEGEFKDDEAVGKRVVLWRDGERFAGNDTRKGPGILYLPNGRRFEGILTDIYSGKGVLWEKDGSLLGSGTFINNIR